MFELIDAAIYGLLKAFPVTAARLAPRVNLQAYALTPHPSPLPRGEGATPVGLESYPLFLQIEHYERVNRLSDAERLESSPLSVKEAVAIQAASGDLRILHAEAAALSQGCFPLGHFGGVPNLDILNSYAAWHSCLGELLLTVTHTMQDGRISRGDYDRLRRALHDDAARGAEILARFKALIHEH